MDVYFKSKLPILKKFYFILSTPLLIHKKSLILFYSLTCTKIYSKILCVYIYLYIILNVSYIISLTNNGHGCVLTWSGQITNKFFLIIFIIIIILETLCGMCVVCAFLSNKLYKVWPPLQIEELIVEPSALGMRQRATIQMLHVLIQSKTESSLVDTYEVQA